MSFEGRGAVTLFTEDGDVYHPESDPAIVHPTQQAALQMAWSPAARLLAVGWADGAVTLWNDVTRKTEETTRVHVRPVSCLVWSRDGSRLVSGDEDGKLCVWTVDAQFRGIPVTPYPERGGRITHLAVRDDGGNAAATAHTHGGGSPEPGLAPGSEGFSFFYAMLNSEGHCTVAELAEAGGRRAVVAEADAALATLLFYPERGGGIVAVRRIPLTLEDGREWRMMVALFSHGPRALGGSLRHCVSAR